MVLTHVKVWPTSTFYLLFLFIYLGQITIVLKNKFLIVIKKNLTCVQSSALSTDYVNRDYIHN